jgi:hypothetical protein
MRVTTIGLEEQAWTPSRRAAQSDLIGARRAVIAKESSATPNGGSARGYPALVIPMTDPTAADPRAPGRMFMHRGAGR